MKIANTPAAEARRQAGIAKQRAQIAEQNTAALAAATHENGTWKISIHGQGPSWRKTALAMIDKLAKRENVTSESLSVLIILPERGRIFTKARGENHLVAHG